MITDLTIHNRKKYDIFHIWVVGGQDFLSLFDKAKRGALTDYKIKSVATEHVKLQR